MINIPSRVKDPHYRYKMPIMKLKTEGRGNGIKTNITNMVEVAECLEVPTDYPLKFLGYELGSQTTYKKEKGEVICIINGEFTPEEVQSKLDVFIDKYVCCAKCTLPELVMKIVDGKIRGDCKSCGNNALLDNKHKMASYITKNPPKKAGAADDKQGQGKKKGDTKDDEAEGGEGVKKRVKREKVFSDVPLREFKEKIVEAGYPVEADSPVIQELIKLYETGLTAVRAEEGVQQWKVVQKAYRNLKTLKIPRNKQVLYGYVFFNSLFGKNIHTQIGKEASLVRKFYKRSHREVQLNHEMVVLLAYTLFDRFKETDYSKYIPTVLKNMFEGKLLTKEFVKDWSEGNLDNVLAEHFLFNKEHNQKLKDLGKPFINFLLKEDEESSSESEDKKSSSEEGSDKEKSGSED